MMVRVLCGGIAMADENWFFGRGARKIIFEGRGPSGAKEIPRQARSDKGVKLGMMQMKIFNRRSPESPLSMGQQKWDHVDS